jgi:hypothetical protein
MFDAHSKIASLPWTEFQQDMRKYLISLELSTATTNPSNELSPSVSPLELDMSRGVRTCLKVGFCVHIARKLSISFSFRKVPGVFEIAVQAFIWRK